MTTEKTIKVSEYFYSIQGEGITMGVPSVFIRLAGCNLLCEGKDWVCDTIPVWRKGESKHIETFVKQIFKQYHKYFVKGTHLIFTGGEPLLQQDEITEFLTVYYNKYEYLPFIEIETNGTKILKDELLKEVDLINCSPKTSNSGMKQDRTINSDVLKQINKMHGSIFKFVISEAEDLIEIQGLIDLLSLDESKIVLMSAGDCREQLYSTAPMVAEICKENNYFYGSRLQVEIWNKTVGV
jgi:organic radical activating enzyme